MWKMALAGLSQEETGYHPCWYSGAYKHMLYPHRGAVSSSNLHQMLFEKIQINVPKHIKSNNKMKLLNHEKEVCCFPFLFSFQIGSPQASPHNLTHSSHSQPCATSFSRKTSLRPDSSQPHVPQQESTNTSCTIISTRSCLQTTTSGKYRTLLQRFPAKKENHQ